MSSDPPSLPPPPASTAPRSDDGAQRWAEGLGAGILLVEDDGEYAALVRTMLEETSLAGFGVEHVELLQAAHRLLVDRGTGCILLDLSLPDASRLEGIERLRAADPDVPIVVLTCYDDEATAVEAVARGAQDYLVKGRSDSYQLARAVRYAIERKRRERELAEGVLRDPLSGLSTRALLVELLRAALERVEQTDRWVALLALNVPDLSESARTFGRDAGDELLGEFAARLSGFCTPASITHVGGGLFFGLSEDLWCEEEAIGVAESLAEDLNREPLLFRGNEVFLKASIGIAVAGHLVDPNGLVHEAESAMRRAEDTERQAGGDSDSGEQRQTNYRVLREEVARGLDYGLSLSEIGDLLASHSSAEELRDAAWLYAWASVEQRERRGS